MKLQSTADWLRRPTYGAIVSVTDGDVGDIEKLNVVVGVYCGIVEITVAIIEGVEIVSGGPDNPTCTQNTDCDDNASCKGNNDCDDNANCGTNSDCDDNVQCDNNIACGGYFGIENSDCTGNTTCSDNNTCDDNINCDDNPICSKNTACEDLNNCTNGKEK